MDTIDKKIVEVLQKNAKKTNSDIAELVNLSPTACLNRVKKLEASGVISGYRAIISPEKIGYSISALVLLKIANNTKDAAHEFATAVKKCPSIVECHMTAGKIDYVAKVYAKDFNDYEKVVKDELSDLPYIASMETLFLFSNLKPDSVFEIPKN